MLEGNVDEKYYLTEDRLNAIRVWEDRQKANGRGFRFEVKDGDAIGRSITTSGDRPCSTNYVAIKNNTKRGFLEAYDGDGVDCSFPTSNTRRGRVQHGISQTLPASGPCIGVAIKSKDKRLKKLVDNTDFVEGEVLNMDLYNQKTNKEISQTLTDPCHNSQRLFDGFRIRKLTPKECWRLMGFDDSDFDKASKVNSNTQLYKQAGNSIVVNVLEGVLGELL